MPSPELEWGREGADLLVPQHWLCFPVEGREAPQCQTGGAQLGWDSGRKKGCWRAEEPVPKHCGPFTFLFSQSGTNLFKILSKNIHPYMQASLPTLSTDGGQGGPRCMDWPTSAPATNPELTRCVRGPGSGGRLWPGKKTLFLLGPKGWSSLHLEPHELGQLWLLARGEFLRKLLCDESSRWRSELSNVSIWRMGVRPPGRSELFFFFLMQDVISFFF